MQKQLVLVTLLVLLLSAFILPAQGQTGGLALHIEQVDTTAYPAITIRLNAWDASGLPLSGLNTADFSLREDNGAPFHPASLQVDSEAPLGVVLALDISGSMSGQPLTDAKVAAARFLDRLKPGDRAALVAFSDPVDTDPAQLNPARELAFTTDLAPLYDLVEKLEAGGQTQLYNAESKAARLAASLPAGHRAVLLLSDGRNEPAEIGDPAEAIRLAKENNIPFFIIGLGDQIDEAHLRKLASETGGLYRSAPRSSELARLFSEMAQLLKTQYLLSYQSSLPADGAIHSLGLGLNTSQGQAEASLDFGPLPRQDATSAPPAATRQPLATPTTAPVSTEIPPTPAPTPQPDGDQPWAWVLAAALAIALGLFMALRRKPRPAPAPEACAQCGFDLTGKTGSCPQCGSNRRLPKKK